MPLKKGAKIEFGGQHKKEEKFMEPTLLTNVNTEMLIMQEEIFGPLLPIITFEKNSDVINFLQKMPSPLSNLHNEWKEKEYSILSRKYCFWWSGY